MPGRQIGPFTLKRFIASGGMGQVWEAHDEELRRSIALKLVLPDRVHERSLALFAREARAGGRLNHPNLVTTLGHGVHDGLAWISQELVPGSWTVKDSLDALRARGTLPKGYYTEVAELVAQVADGMQAAHGAGVIHRDIKPQNILLTSDCQPKVTDFGLARVADDPFLSRTGDLGGTWAYMSPEQVTANRGKVDHKTDVFSLGIVLYELLTLRRPFEGDTTHQVAAQIIGVDPPDANAIRSQCPADLAVICGRAMEKQLERRYSTMAELAADLRRHLRREPILAQPPGRVRKAFLWAQRNPTKSVAGMILLLAVCAISVLLLDLARANSSLVEVNEGLEAETRRANDERDRALEAEGLADERRREAETRTAEVLRLSALQDYEDLITEADSLWPAHPDNIPRLEAWIQRARALVDELPSHRAKLKELRAMALAQSERERALDREAHEELPLLLALEGRIRSTSRALERRRGGANVELPDLSPDDLLLDVGRLDELAWPLVDPAREQWGDEARGLALALRALELAEESQELMHQAVVGYTVAWGYFALGRDEEARRASKLAHERAIGEAKAQFAIYYDDIVAATGAAADPAALASAEAEIAVLEGQRAELAERVAERQSWQFPETDSGASARWWHSNLSLLIDSLESLEDPVSGLLSGQQDAVSPVHGWSIVRRLAFARGLLTAMQTEPESSRRWGEAIADIRESDVYGGLELAPQVGLVPVGKDARSGLWEFWLQGTGEEPERDEDGELILVEEMGAILVLIPGGGFWMGATSEPGAPHNFDPQARAHEGPVHLVELSPYFLSKFELTQGQWLRFTGSNPSQHQPPNPLSPSLLHPVADVSWLEAMEQLERMGVTLPSEAQWENACRAGTSWPWWTGPERESLRTLNAVNLTDRTAVEAGADWPTIDDWPDFDDGYALHAPVGTFAANGYGLHDVHGNLNEWCLDGYDEFFYGRSPTRDPVAPHEGASSRVDRGGSYYGTAERARASSRAIDAPWFKVSGLGVRPARSVTR